MTSVTVDNGRPRLEWNNHYNPDKKWVECYHFTGDGWYVDVQQPDGKQQNEYVESHGFGADFEAAVKKFSEVVERLEKE